MNKLLLLFTFVVLGACTPHQTTRPDITLPSSASQHYVTHPQFSRPKNVILIIGDGMGLAQATAGMYINGNKLNLEEFKYIGLHKTHSSNNLITDSAAGGTAIACGVKTNNGVIGLNSSGKSVPSILEEAEKADMATGIVVTCSMPHATPASFFAHQKDREMMEEIAADMLKVDIDFFVGGGLKYFTHRKDGQNLLDKLSKKGYVIHSYLDADFSNITIDFSKKFGYFTADSEPASFSEGRDYLPQACHTAVTYLSGQNTRGFFLMIEGSQIDWAGHANNSNFIISEVIDLDNAIGAVLKFAKEDGNTLVIVTADHETGGYAINPGSKMDSISPAFTTDKHTAVLVPVYAFGPGAELFSGMYENTAIYDKILLALGLNKS